MFGNRLGWGISAVIVLVAAYLAYQLHMLGQPTAATGELVATITGHPASLAELARPLLPPAKPLGDAGDAYRKAIDAYDHDQAAYDGLVGSKDYDRAAVDKLTAFDDLVAGDDLPTMDLFASRPGLIVNYDATVAPLASLDGLAKSASFVIALAAYKDTKDYVTAKRLSQGLLGLGLHLYQERVAYDELADGISLMGVGLGGLKKVAQETGDKPALDAIAKLDAARLAEYEQDKAAWNMVTSLNEGMIARHAGDYFQVADDAAVDPVWRVEAIRRLGRLKMNPPKLADQVRAVKRLRELAADTSLPPAMRQAAEKSRDITSRENQSSR